MKMDRRDLLAGIGGIGAGIVLSSCSGASWLFPAGTQTPQRDEEVMGGEVAATEDLMREHGVLRRALFVYSETAERLRNNPSSVAPDAIAKTAKLFRTFGEDYHERKLEETFIFPVVKRGGGEAAGLIDVLVAQHHRGREITDYVLAVTRRNESVIGDVGQLARAMGSMVRMYRPHAAREDTIVFPAWKQTLTARQLDEMSEKFEEIEHQQFGEDGFDNAVRQISDIERELGMAELARFTAAPIAK